MKELKIPVEKQLRYFKEGLPKVNLVKSAALSDGIHKIYDYEQKEYLDLVKELNSEKILMKFVPASGAATRMFSKLEWILNNDKIQCLNDIENEDDKKLLNYFFQNIKKLPFFPKIEKKAKKKEIELPENIDNNTDIRKLIELIIGDKYLNYANKPKALIPFHRYSNILRTPIYEHIQEAKEYLLQNNSIKIHFTVLPEHQKKVLKKLKKIADNEVIQIIYELSIQDPSTNTIAVDMSNNPVEIEKGRFLERPGGHGALIYNLNKLEADVVYIKNIDNVMPSNKSEGDNEFKRIMSGYFKKIQDKLFYFCRNIIENPDDKALRKEIIKYYKDTFYLDINDEEDLIEYINRPLRVCAVVKNEGQPGGGPYFVEKDDKISLQIIESAQIDKDDDKQVKIMESSTHFNPVDMICSLTNFRGEKFNLLDYIDEDLSFITTKSYNGKAIKALELPGLWNGAMANWNTVFLEMPAKYFNPVKTVFDLLDEKRMN